MRVVPTKDDIFVMNKKKEVGLGDTTYEYEYYTVKGVEDWIDKEGFPRLNDGESSEVHAKIVHNEMRTRYYIKKNSRGRIFNPFGLYDEKPRAQRLRHASRPQWQFRQTKEEVFYHYINFLATKNPAHLSNAERSTS
jgi:hypothetical protein